MTHNKSPEEYRWLAEKCRETARTISADNGRADLLARAEIWDLIADRLEPAPRPEFRVKQRSGVLAIVGGRRSRGGQK
jgi:hypothetical protein